jgi:hypothetical protein
MVAGYRLSWAVAGLMLLQSLTGLLLPHQYRDAAWIEAAWFGNDSVTLAIAVPLMTAALALAARGSARGLLLLVGMLGYAIYNYAYYLLGAALNPSFPLYLATVVSAAAALVLTVSNIDAVSVARTFPARTTVRLAGAYLVFVGLALASVWLTMWAAYVFAGRPTPVEPDAFRLVAALDCALMVPALVAGGALLWRRQPWGYVIATAAAIQSTLYLLGLSVGSIVAVHRGLAVFPGELPIWGILAASTGAVTLVLFLNAPWDKGGVTPGAEV